MIAKAVKQQNKLLREGYAASILRGITDAAGRSPGQPPLTDRALKRLLGWTR